MQGYTELPEKLVDAWAAAAAEALRLLEAERCIEKAVTLESFKDTCALWSKFSNSKNVDALFNFVLVSPCLNSA